MRWTLALVVFRIIARARRLGAPGRSAVPRSRGAGVLAVALSLVACAGDGPAPAVRLLVPARARAGETVEIQGAGFAGVGFVAFGARAGAVTMWEDDRIRVQVPTMPPGATTLVVTVDGRQSEPARFEVDP